MARKTRVETYLDTATVEQLDELDEDKSAFIRRAVNDALEDLA